MASRIKLVKDDTGPTLVFSLTDEFTGDPIDLSNIGTTMLFKFRAVGSTTVKASISMTKLVGFLNDDGTINSNPPYDVAGAGGRCQMAWSASALDTVGEFEAEIEITFSTGVIQTVYDLLKFSIRADF